jgi:hypothetical protein
MYPSRELTEIAARKDIRRAAISRQRRECVAAAGRLAKPFEWFDRARTLWQRVSPLLAFLVPSGGPSVLGRTASIFRLGRIAARWSPALFRVLKSFRRPRSEL